MGLRGHFTQLRTWAPSYCLTNIREAHRAPPGRGGRDSTLLSILIASWWHHSACEVPTGCLSISVALSSLETSAGEIQLPWDPQEPFLTFKHSPHPALLLGDLPQNLSSELGVLQDRIDLSYLPVAYFNPHGISWYSQAFFLAQYHATLFTFRFRKCISLRLCCPPNVSVLKGSINLLCGNKSM